MNRRGEVLPTRNVLIAIVLGAGLAVAVMGIKAADVLSIGRRPDPSAFRDFLLSTAIGLLLGVLLGLCMRVLLRRYRGFFVEFYATPVWQRSWQLQRWNLLYSVPIFIGLEVLFTATFKLEISPQPALLASAICFAITGSRLEEILRAASELKANRLAAGQRTEAVAHWTGDITPRQFVRWSALSLISVVAIGFTGYTMALPRLAEIEESRVIVRKLRHSIAEQEAFYRLTDVARRASRTCNTERLIEGETTARQLLQIYPSYEYDWNYGNAIHYGNLVLGRIALQRDNVAAAKRYLLRAGETPGSPQIGDYGPDMTLARELLEHGESPAVLRYFSLCTRIWGNKQRNCVLTEWAGAIQQGRTPEFGERAGPVPLPAEGWTCETLEGGS
jgi:hypothetical protein